MFSFRTTKVKKWASQTGIPVPNQQIFLFPSHLADEARKSTCRARFGILIKFTPIS
jgi:hypothetical protein